jgi:hypothetical protein
VPIHRKGKRCLFAYGYFKGTYTSGARVSIVNAIAATPQRGQQALLDFPRDQFPRLIALQCGRSEMLDRGNLCFGKYYDLDIHGGNAPFLLRPEQNE